MSATAREHGRGAFGSLDRLRPLVVAGVVLGLDQATKAAVRGGISPGDRDGVLPGIELVNVRNRGVAFGLLSQGRALVVVLTAAVLCILVGYYLLHQDRPLLWLAVGLLLGGASGNLIDRVRSDAVTDFIDVPLWPAFNLADVAITAGVLVLLFALEEGGARA